MKNKTVSILSRRNNVLTDQFPTITATCADLQDGSVIDGEIIALDENDRPSFNALQNRRFHKEAVQFYAFDLLTYARHSLLSLPFEKRREWLQRALTPVADPVRFSAPLKMPILIRWSLRQSRRDWKALSRSGATAAMSRESEAEHGRSSS